MAEVTATLDLDRIENDVRIHLHDVIVKDEAIRMGKTVKANVVRLIEERAEVNSPGGLASSIFGSVDDDGDSWIVTIAADEEHEDVALWFEEGTGLFGPRNQYIVPRTHAFMYFLPRGAARKVRAIRVVGQEGKHPFRDGLEASQPLI